VPPVSQTATAPATPIRSTDSTPATGGVGRGWIRRLWAYCCKHPRVTWMAGLSALAGVGLGALTPLLTGSAINHATTGSTAGLPLVIAALVALAVIRFVSSFIRRWAGGRLSLDVQHDLRQDVFAALARLERGGPATSAELARIEQISPQSMGAILAGLEERGLVRRNADPLDGRRVVMSVTNAGLQTVGKRRDVRVEQIAAALDGFTKAELRQILTATPLIERLADGL